MHGKRITRRNFLVSAVAGTAALALGCSALPRPRRMAGLNTAFPIPRRKIGNTGLEASILGCGSHISEEVMKIRGERERQIRYALDSSINFFDIYRQPGPQYEIMSKVLRAAGDDVIISLMNPGSLAELEKILKIFRRDRIEMIRFYSRGKLNPVPEKDYAEMMKAKEQGKLGAIGVAAHYEEELVYEFERRELDFALVVYNFHEDRNEYPRLVPMARERSAALIAMKPFGCGSLIQFAGNVRPRKEFRDIPDVSIPAAALHYIYQNPGITIAIPSMYSLPEFRENVKAVQDPDLSAEEETLLRRVSAAAGPSRCKYPKFEKELDKYINDINLEEQL
ncbi:MAG: aldo/keto reductase [Kiritimatiellae bacterium]|nr:aldo/keto reductase [Kiritimatiellia bacterium]